MSISDDLLGIARRDGIEGTALGDDLRTLSRRAARQRQSIESLRARDDSRRKSVFDAHKERDAAREEVARLRGEMAVAVQVAGRGLHWSDCYGAHFPTSGAVEETADGAAMLASLAKEAEAHNAAMREQGRRAGLLEASEAALKASEARVESAYRDGWEDSERAECFDRVEDYLTAYLAALSPEEGG